MTNNQDINYHEAEMMASIQSIDNNLTSMLWVDLNDIQSEVITGGYYCSYYLKHYKFNTKTKQYVKVHEPITITNGYGYMNGNVVKGELITNSTGAQWISYVS